MAITEVEIQMELATKIMNLSVKSRVTEVTLSPVQDVSMKGKRSACPKSNIAMATAMMRKGVAGPTLSYMRPPKG